LAADSYVIELKTLKYAESWELFCKKAFHASKDNKCPENLISWANKIVTKCQGLPLAIVTIGSILSYRELEEQVWKFFYNQLSWHIENNPELNWISSVLNLSLNNLPSYLRSCFLYCSLYPEDYKIKKETYFQAMDRRRSRGGGRRWNNDGGSCRVLPYGAHSTLSSSGHGKECLWKS